MNMKNLWNVINTLLIVVLLMIIVFFQNKKEEIVFIDNVRVFKGFNMTSELGKINEKKYEPQLKRFDSLVKSLTDMESILSKKSQLSNSDKEAYANLKRVVVLQDQEMQNLRIAVKDDINKQVWERLNTYVNEYGKEKEIKLILGAQGQGNIMYGDSLKDITNDFLVYANNKYEGN